MDENENLETQPAELDGQEPSGIADDGEPMGEGEPGAEGETNKEPTEPVEEPVDEVKKALEGQLQREKDRRNGVIADKNIVAKTLKGFMDEFGVSYEEAAKIAGISANDLKARVENLETSDNPVAAFSASFDELYLGKGGKAMLDDLYGADTQAFVSAFAKYGLNDPDLQEQAFALEPTKALSFVVKKGKEILEELGGVDVDVRTLAKENTALKAELAKLKAGQSDSDPVPEKRKSLPLDSIAGRGANGGIGSGAVLPKGMF